MMTKLKLRGSVEERRVIVAVGINTYAKWPRLDNAVADAQGALELFQRLGFNVERPPLFDAEATGHAIRKLATDDLATLKKTDSLIVFFAGHGGTRTQVIEDTQIKTGYILPVDADPDQYATWIDLDDWLEQLARLPARHILVIIDACHSGLALGKIVKYRDIERPKSSKLAEHHRRVSRRIITSAGEDQPALDSGPILGHSLFTGCLIEGLSGGIKPADRTVTTSSELGWYLQQRVSATSDSSQTPDFGSLAYDRRGELLIPLLGASSPEPEAGQEQPRRPGRRRSIEVGLFGATVAGAIGLAITLPHFRKTTSSPMDAPSKLVPPDSMSDPGTKDSPVMNAPSIDAQNAGATPTATPPSCAGLSSMCGAHIDDTCCNSLAVPGGTYYLSYDNAGDDISGDRSALASISDFRLDKYEVTVGRFRAFVNAGMGTQANPPEANAGAHPRIEGSGWKTSWNASLVRDKVALVEAVKCVPKFQTWTDEPSNNENRPITCLTWYEAMAFCAWDGGYLPTEAEWNYAATGGDQQRAYPWSNPAGSLTLDSAHASYGCIGDGASGCTRTDLVAVGTKPAGDGRWGQSDLAGNVWEWILDWHAAYGSSCTDCANLTPTSERVVRGGSFGNEAPHLRTGSRGFDAPTSRDPYRGARCARAR